jgi:hypothetical protein
MYRQGPFTKSCGRCITSFLRHVAEMGHNLGTWHANTWLPAAAANADGKYAAGCIQNTNEQHHSCRPSPCSWRTACPLTTVFKGALNPAVIFILLPVYGVSFTRLPSPRMSLDLAIHFTLLPAHGA